MGGDLRAIGTVFQPFHRVSRVIARPGDPG
jgi:hypothetical protein